MIYAITFKHYFEGTKGTNWYFEWFPITHYRGVKETLSLVRKFYYHIESVKLISSGYFSG